MSASQIRVKQTSKGNTISGTDCSAAAIATTTGNLLVALVETASGTNPCTGVKNGAGVSFTQIGSTVVNSGPSQLQMFYLKNITGSGSDAVKASWALAPSIPIVFVWEVENADTTSPFLTEGTATTSSGPASISSGGITVTDDCIVLMGVTAFSVATGTYTETSGGVGIIFDDPKLNVTGFSGGTACAAHSFFSGSNSGVVFSITGDTTQKSMITAAFKAAAGKGVKLNVVCQGDSITLGLGVTTPWTSSLDLNIANQVINKGVTSQTLATMVSNAATVVDPCLRANMTNVCVIWGGTNDFVLGSSVGTVESNFATYVGARKTAGWNKVITVEMLDRGDTTVDTQKAAYNTYLLGLPASVDGTVVMDATNLVADNAWMNTTYFQTDKVHPTQLSDDTLIAPPISTLINTITHTPNSGKVTILCMSM